VACGKRAKDERVLNDIETQLEVLYLRDLVGFMNEKHKSMVLELEKKKRLLLDEKDLRAKLFGW
jgi:hypothetical protein